jgi:hypothetical protein
VPQKMQIILQKGRKIVCFAAKCRSVLNKNAVRFATKRE